MSHPKPTADSNETPLILPKWERALRASPLSPATRAAYGGAVGEFLRHCETQQTPATVMRAKHYLEVADIPDPVGTRDALRWFVRAARAAQSAAKRDDAPNAQPAAVSVEPAVRPRPNEPPRARDDLGGDSSDWLRPTVM